MSITHKIGVVVSKIVVLPIWLLLYTLISNHFKAWKFLLIKLPRIIIGSF